MQPTQIINLLKSKTANHEVTTTQREKINSGTNSHLMDINLNDCGTEC